MGSGLAIQFFHWNMRKLGNKPKRSPRYLPYVLFVDNAGMVTSALREIAEAAKAWLSGMLTRQSVKTDRIAVDSDANSQSALAGKVLYYYGLPVGL